MEDRSTGMSWIAVLFVIIVIFAIFGGNFGGGCCGFNRRLDAIEGRMLTKPNLYGVASTCGGQIIPATCNGSGNI